MYKKRRKEKNLLLMELYNEVSDKANIHRSTTKEVLDKMWPILRDYITKGYEVRIPAFGVFAQRIRLARDNFDVNGSGRIVYSPESTIIHFEPEKDWREEHYIANAQIPDEIPNGMRLSKRFIPLIRQRLGEEGLKKYWPDETMASGCTNK